MAFQDKARQWIAVVRQLAADRETPIRCPFCGKADLGITDVPFSDQAVERRIACPGCNEGTALRMARRTWP